MDPLIIPSPPGVTHSHTIIFLHGRGDTAGKFAETLQFSAGSADQTLLELFKDFRWVFPRAGLRPCASERGEKWSQWFDVWNIRDFSDKEDLQAVGLKESVLSLRNLLETEVALLDGRWDRIILAGISQGAATAAHTLLNLTPPAVIDEKGLQVPAKLAAFIGFSCRMPFAGRTLAETRKILDLPDVSETDTFICKTPVLLQHCADDRLVKIQHGEELRDTLVRFGANVTWKAYPRGGHWFNDPNGIDDAHTFLANLIGQPLT